MLFNVARDWKQYLTDEDEEKLNDMIKHVAKHRGAYKNAEEVKIAQLWCSLLELRKENDDLKKKLRQMEEIFETMVEKRKKQLEEKEELIKSIEKF